MEKNAHGVHAERLSPAEFGINARGIESVGLPHFELVDGVGGDVVAADEPGLLVVPGVGGGFGPARRTGVSRSHSHKEQSECESQREANQGCG